MMTPQQAKILLDAIELMLRTEAVLPGGAAFEEAMDTLRRYALEGATT